VERWTYAAVLAFIVVGSGWLEFGLRTRIVRRRKRWALSILPAFIIFVLWDLYAIAAGHWHFDPQRVTGASFPGGLPVEEVLFFVVVPTAGLLTLEAVRSMTGWAAGDESGGERT